MSEPRVVVLVDAQNVRRSRWPNLTERELIERCRHWADAHGHRALVVFDGTAPGGLVGEDEREPACGIAGSGRESADDWIARRAAELARTGQPYWLVTSDRELRRRAGQQAQKQIGGGAFVKLLSPGP